MIEVPKLSPAFLHGMEQNYIEGQASVLEMLRKQHAKGVRKPIAMLRVPTGGTTWWGFQYDYDPETDSAIEVRRQHYQFCEL